MKVSEKIKFSLFVLGLLVIVVAIVLGMEALGGKEAENIQEDVLIVGSDSGHFQKSASIATEQQQNTSSSNIHKIMSDRVAIEAITRKLEKTIKIEMEYFEKSNLPDHVKAQIRQQSQELLRSIEPTIDSFRNREMSRAELKEIRKMMNEVERTSYYGLKFARFATYSSQAEIAEKKDKLVSELNSDANVSLKMKNGLIDVLSQML